MSTEVVPFEQKANNGAVAVRDIDSWVLVVRDVAKLAEFICNTEFVPGPLRGKPAAITAAMLAGREAGIPPLRALSHVHIVDGRPSLSAEQKRALALAAGHEISYEEVTTERCIVKGRRRGSEAWSHVTWTMDDAKRASLTGKQNWRNYPRRMLEARATGELCDMLFPDATAGLPTFEELVDDTDATGITTGDAAPPKRRTAQRARASKAPAGREQPADGNAASPAPDPPVSTTPAPPLPGEPGYDDPPEPPAAEAEPEESTVDDDQPITRPQSRRLHATFTALDITERDRRLRIASLIVGHELASSDELTKGEATVLIDTLSSIENSDDPAGNLAEILDALRESSQQQEE